MGYGIWNATGLDRDDEPTTLNFDYAYTTQEELRELRESGEIGAGEDITRFSQDEREQEFDDHAAAICAAGHHLATLGVDVTAYGHTMDAQGPLAWALHGDRYQYLKTAFTAGKCGVWWQEEPFMEACICVVTAPLHYLVEDHPVWTMDDAEFAREFHMTVERYTRAATNQASLFTDFMLAWMERELSCVTTRRAWRGSGYIGTTFAQDRLVPFDTAQRRVVDSLLTREQAEARRGERKAVRRELRRAALREAAAPQLATIRARVL